MTASAQELSVISLRFRLVLNWLNLAEYSMINALRVDFLLRKVLLKVVEVVTGSLPSTPSNCILAKNWIPRLTYGLESLMAGTLQSVI